MSIEVYRPSGTYQLLPAVIGVFAALSLSVLGYLNQQITLQLVSNMLLSILLLILLGAMREYSHSKLIFTAERLIWNTTFFRTKSEIIPYSLIQNVTITMQQSRFFKHKKIIEVRIQTQRNNTHHEFILDPIFFTDMSLNFEQTLDSALSADVVKEKIPMIHLNPVASRYLIQYARQSKTNLGEKANGKAKD